MDTDMNLVRGEGGDDGWVGWRIRISGLAEWAAGGCMWRWIDIAARLHQDFTTSLLTHMFCFLPCMFFRLIIGSIKSLFTNVLTNVRICV
jgi:hypothetical protein